VVALGRSAAGVWCVAVCDGDWLLKVDQPVYYSPTIDARRRDGGDGIVLKVALTFATARVAARPVELLAGDIRSSLDRFRMSFTPRQRQVVDYVVEELRHRATGEPIVLGGDPRVVRRDEDVPIPFPLYRQGGPLPRSGFCGRIISVR
jgi:hypothetical protein